MRARNSVASRTARGSTFRIPRSLSSVTLGFPKQLEIRQRFCTGITLSISALATAPVTEQFSVNGLFDPFTSGGGHQPLYFDQLAAIYNNYTCLKSKITVSFNPPASASAPMVVGIYVEDNTTITPTTIAGVTEQSTSVWRSLPATPGYASQTLSKAWDAKQTFGGNIRDNDDLGGSSLANPVLQQYFTVFAAPNGSPSGGISVVAYVTVEYTAVWDNLVNMAQNV